MASKKLDAAIRGLEDKMRGNPRSRAFSRLADSYRAAGDLQKAVDMCVSGLAEHPGYVTGRLVLGRCYAEMKNFEAAVSELTAVCSTDRRNHAAMKLLADVFIKQGRGEAAGRIYSILREMEPENGAIRQLAAKHRSNLQGTILDILGIRDDTESLTRNLMASGVDPFDMQNLETIQGAQTGVYGSDATVTSEFGAAPSLRPAGEPTGGDVANQLDVMFGNMAPPQPAVRPAAPTIRFDARPAAGVSGDITGEDVGNALDAIFGSDTPQAPQPPQRPPLQQPPQMRQPQQQPTALQPPPAFGGPQAIGQPSGEDIAGALDAMFGGGVQSPAADMGAPGIDTGIIVPAAADGLTGSDVADQLDAMFGTGMQAPTIAVDTGALGMDTGIITLTGSGEPTGSDVADQLDAMFGAGMQAPAVDMSSLGIDTGIITLTDTGEPTGSDVANQLDVMFGTGIQAPTVDMSAFDIIGTGAVIPTDTGEPTGSDVADQLDVMFGIGAQAPAVDMSAIGIIDTGAIIPTDTGEPTGSDVADQLDVMFGIGAQAPAADVNIPVIDTSVITHAAVSELTGSDVADQLDVMFGLQSTETPDIPADLGTSGLTLTPTTAGALDTVDAAQASGSIGDRLDSLFGFADTEQPDAEALIAEPDSGAAAGYSDGFDATAVNTPTNLFDFGTDETLQIDSGDLAAAMAADKEERLFDFGAEEALLGNVSDTAATLITDRDGITNPFDFGAAAPAPNDTDSFKQNVPDPDADTIAFRPNVPSEGTEIVHGDDIELRLTELFDADEKTAELTESLTAEELEGIDDILDTIDAGDAAAASSADGPDGVVTDTIEFTGTDETLSMDDLEDIIADSGIMDAVTGAGASVDIDTANATIAVEADTGGGIDETDISAKRESDELPPDGLDDLENHLRDILGEDVEIGSVEPLTAEDGSIGNVSEKTGDDGVIGESDIIDGTLEKNDDADGVAEAGITEASLEPLTAEIETAEPDAVGIGIPNAPPVKPAPCNGLTGEEDAATDGRDGAARTAFKRPTRKFEAVEPCASEDDVQEKIRELFKSESSEEVSVIDVGGADAGVDSVIDERDTPFDLPDHVLTPTLADIYYQQGQPKLALHIYERLSLRDPSDQRLQLQVQAIKDALLQMGDDAGLDVPAGSGIEKPIRAAAGTRKKKTAESKDDKRPLAGVRINKKGKPPAKKRKL